MAADRRTDRFTDGFPDRSNDRTRNLDELRRIAERHHRHGASRADVEASMRNDADALTFVARLRRSGMSDAEVAAAVFDSWDAGR